MTISIYERINIVCADLARLNISNDDPMRYSKRCCALQASAALENGVRQAEEMLRLVHNIESDVRELTKGEA